MDLKSALPILGAALVVVVVAAVAIVKNVDFDKESIPAEEESYSFDVTFADASSVLPDYKGITYGPNNLFDGDKTTAWVEGADGCGTSEWVTVACEGNKTIKALLIRNGYQKSEEVYNNNCRVKDAVAVFEDGSRENFRLEDNYGKEQHVVFSKPHPGDGVKIMIKSVYPGVDYDDTCISEIEFSDYTGDLSGTIEVKGEADAGSDPEEDLWGHFAKVDQIGKNIDKISSEVQVKAVDKELYGDRWQGQCGLSGIFWDGSLYVQWGTELSYSIDDYDGICYGMGGTAGELFGLESDMDVGDFISIIEGFVGDESTYYFNYRKLNSEDRRNCWQAYRNADREPVKSMFKLGGGYNIEVYCDGLENVIERYDITEDLANVPENSVDTYFGGCDDSCYVITPGTKIVVWAIPYGTGY